jgi:hypothetical protein
MQGDGTQSLIYVPFLGLLCQLITVQTDRTAGHCRHLLVVIPVTQKLPVRIAGNWAGIRSRDLSNKTQLNTLLNCVCMQFASITLV